MGHIDLSVPLAGVSGVAFILPQAVSPGSGRHRVYVKRMLLGPRVDQVLPDWAFFVRAVIDSDTLVADRLPRAGARRRDAARPPARRWPSSCKPGRSAR
ncbi:MAG: hypothetical protein QM804_19210 [Propionicimonas sp.]